MHLVTPLISHMVNSDDYTAKEFEAVHTIVGGSNLAISILMLVVPVYYAQVILFTVGCLLLRNPLCTFQVLLLR